FEKAKEGGELKTSGLPPLAIEVPKDPAHGDLASNVALVLARSEGRPPRYIAETLQRHLRQTDDLASVTVAGPGFLNFKLAREFWWKRLAEARSAGERFGRPTLGRRLSVQVEFVSANPTGPLTVGHGRNAVLGDSIARLLEVCGHEVIREYYFNNAGRQMQVLGESVRARYLERLGLPSRFPDDGYQGDYIREIAADLEAKHGPMLADASDHKPFQQHAERAIFADIEATLERMRIRFDVHGVIYQFVTLLRAGQLVKMSTRRAEYVTLDELVAEVGTDVVRFLFLTRKADTHLEFDLDLAKQQSMENPVYYVQYAYARI